MSPLTNDLALPHRELSEAACSIFSCGVVTDEWDALFVISLAENALQAITIEDCAYIRASRFLVIGEWRL